MVASTLPSGGGRAAIAARYSHHTRFPKRRHRDLVVGLICSCIRILAFPVEARSPRPLRVPNPKRMTR